MKKGLCIGLIATLFCAAAEAATTINSTHKYAYGNDKLMITDMEADGTTNSVTWTVKTTRRYTLMSADALTTNTVWTATGASFIPSSEPQVTVTLTGINATNRFYGIKAELPLP